MSDHYLDLVAGLAMPESHGSMAPGNVLQSIEQLPLASPVLAAGKLLQILDSLLHGSSGTPADRSRALASLQMPLQALTAGLLKQIAVEGHPLPSAKAEMARTLFSACCRHGDACCLAVYEATAPGGKVSLFSRGSISRLLARAMDSLGMALRLSYQLYEVPPATPWQRLHAAYAYAAEHKLGGREVDIDGYRGSLRDRYASSLLLALSNPFAFQRDEMTRVVRACRALAPQAALIGSLGGTAAVTSASASGGPGYLPQERAKPGHGHWSLDLEPVIDAVRDQLAWTPAEQPATLRPQHGEPVEIPRYLLERLAKAWVGTVERDHARADAEHSLEAVLGLHALHQALAGGLNFESFQHQIHGREIELSGQDAASWVGARGSAGAAQLDVQILDQSLGGYRLQWPLQQRQRVHIGELVGLSAQAGGATNEAPWLIGIVRWLRSERNGDLQVGVELLSRHARPAAVRGRLDKGERGPMQRALLLDAEAGGESELLLPRIGESMLHAAEITAPADRLRDVPALRAALREFAAAEALGSGYYRVSLSLPADAAS